MTPEEQHKRRMAIVASFREHGATKTAKAFGISRNAVYLTLNTARYGARYRKPRKEKP